MIVFANFLHIHYPCMCWGGWMLPLPHILELPSTNFSNQALVPLCRYREHQIRGLLWFTVTNFAPQRDYLLAFSCSLSLQVFEATEEAPAFVFRSAIRALESYIQYGVMWCEWLVFFIGLARHVECAEDYCNHLLQSIWRGSYRSCWQLDCVHLLPPSCLQGCRGNLRHMGTRFRPRPRCMIETERARIENTPYDIKYYCHIPFITEKLWLLLSRVCLKFSSLSQILKFVSNYP